MINNKEIIEESICKVDEFRNKRWYNSKGELHRQNDLPAIEFVNRDKWWYLNGKRHREKGPAIELINGIKYWYWHGKRIEVNSQEEFEEKLPYLIMKEVHEQ